MPRVRHPGAGVMVVVIVAVGGGGRHENYLRSASNLSSLFFVS